MRRTRLLTASLAIATFPLVTAAAPAPTNPPYIQAVKDMWNAVCKQETYMAMKPYLTPQSQLFFPTVVVSFRAGLSRQGIRESDFVEAGCPVKIIRAERLTRAMYRVYYRFADGTKDSQSDVIEQNGKWGVNMQEF